MGSARGGHQTCSSAHGHHRVGLLGEVADGDGFVAVWAVAAGVDASAEQVAVRAAAFVEVAGFAVGAFIDGAESSEVETAGWPAHRVPPSATTPAPASAWDRRTLSPLVWQTWAWCSSRSTVAVARVLGISSSNAAGCRFELIATERFS